MAEQDILALKTKPTSDFGKPKCDFCVWQLVAKVTEKDAACRAERVFRCLSCGAFMVVAVSRAHEINFTNRVKPGPMPDQMTVLELLESPEP